MPEPEDLKPKESNIMKIMGFGRNHRKQEEFVIPEGWPHGMYLYGDVGCGKTMLMDLFYETLPPNIKNKKRIHFHGFMQDIHKQNHLIKQAHGLAVDAMPLITATIAQEATVLCLDEFQVTDIADAMILRRLLESLLSYGVIIVTTSNRKPTELYKNGIQRDQFIPAIKLIETKLDVICLDSPVDFRKIARPMKQVYFSPVDEHATEAAEKWFEYFSQDAKEPPHPAEHSIWGRKVKVPKAAGKVAWIDFHSLCEQPLGAPDYLELTKVYRVFIVTDIPRITRKDLARRFITFLDSVYDTKVNHFVF